MKHAQLPKWASWRQCLHHCTLYPGPGIVCVNERLLSKWIKWSHRLWPLPIAQVSVCLGRGVLALLRTCNWAWAISGCSGIHSRSAPQQAHLESSTLRTGGGWEGNKGPVPCCSLNRDAGLWRWLKGKEPGEGGGQRGLLPQYCVRGTLIYYWPGL